MTRPVLLVALALLCAWACALPSAVAAVRLPLRQSPSRGGSLGLAGEPIEELVPWGAQPKPASLPPSAETPAAGQPVAPPPAPFVHPASGSATFSVAPDAAPLPAFAPEAAPSPSLDDAQLQPSGPGPAAPEAPALAGEAAEASEASPNPSPSPSPSPSESQAPAELPPTADGAAANEAPVQVQRQGGGYALSAEQLAAATGTPLARAQRWVASINAAAKQFDINTPLRMAAFLAQIAHESGRFTIMAENMRYTAQGLRKTFPRYFNAAQAAAYARQPERIGNRAYANRMGNGNEASGDGYRYRGRGLIQLTGKFMYKQFGAAVGQDFVANPALIETERFAALSAGWFWNRTKLNPLADQGRITRISTLINGGYNGMAERKRMYAVACKVLKCPPVASK